MKAIIVPGVTDLNKGDQALVWESHRLINDANLYKDIFILNSGDTVEEKELLCSQSEERGYKLLDNILKHPRRGQHKPGEHIKDSKLELLKQVINAGCDFISTSFLLLICSNLFLVKLLYSKKVLNTIVQFKTSDSVFVKGGGFIHAYGEKTAPYLMWYFLFYIRLAKRLKKKVVFLPNSFGPFEGLTVKNQVRNVFNNLDLIYARENVSANSLSNLINRNIPVEMDLGFFLNEGELEESERILSKYNLNSSDKIVGITIRPWRFPGLDNPEELYENYIDSVVKLSNHVLKQGYKVALCNQSLGPNAHEDDRNAIKKFLSKIDNENIVWINENLPCDILKAVYSHFYFFIGTRFHSIIFSLTSLVPSLAIGYGGNKAKGIMSDFNLEEYVVQIQDVSPAKLINIFDDAIENYDNIRSSLKDSMELVRQSRARMIGGIRNL